jgi:zinc resistance-associated protein
MKKLATVLGTLVLVAGLAVTVFAWAPGWGFGNHMMGYWGGGPAYGGGYGNLTPDQRSRLDTLNGQFYNETTSIRNEIWTKSAELDALVNGPNPDLEKAKALQKEIGALQAKLDEKQVNYDLEARKLGVQGGGYGGGYGPHMGGFAYGMMGGYGPGACWNY